MSEMQTQTQAEASINLGKQLMEQGKLDEAISCYRKVLVESDAPLSEVYYRLGEALGKKGELDEAIRYYRQAIKLKPNYFWSHHNLGEILAKQGHLEKAIASYRKAIELNPKISWSHERLGEALTKKGELDEAISCFNQGIKLNPINFSSHYNLGETLAKKGKIKEAIASYQKAIAINPKSAICYYKLGKAFRRQGKIDEVVACYKKAIEINPNFKQAYIELQYFPLQEKQLDELIELYRKIINSKPDFHLVWANLGDALTEQNKIDEAIKCYQTTAYEQTIQSNPHLAKLNWKSKKEKGPDFLIIGSSKCGTTSLYLYLLRHPQILGGHKKELNFFNKHFEKRVDWYLSHFPSITDNPDFLSGESTPGYIDFPDVDRRIFQLFPNVKLIVLLRNPVDRTVSQYHHNVRSGVEKRSLEEVIGSEIEQLQQATELELSYSKKSTCVSRSLYYYRLQRWMNLFPREQFLILKSEDFYSDTATTMQTVCRFLNLPEHQFSQFSKHQAGDYASAAVSDRVRQTLTDYFRPHNQKLEDFLGIKFNWDGQISQQASSRDTLLSLMPKHSVCAEIGVYKGDFSAKVLDCVQPAKLHLIDPWQYKEEREYKNAWYCGKAGDQLNMDAVYDSVLKRFNQEIERGIVFAHRALSWNAASQFEDEYFDWVYVDGDHQYESIKKDLEFYYRKVKKGGYIAGDDYDVKGWWQNGVKKAVDEFRAQGSCKTILIEGGQFILQKL